MTLTNAVPSVPSLAQLLDMVRSRIQVQPAELDEARLRRGAIVAILVAEFPGGRAYFNGSVAHGDALTPLSDVDLGYVVPDPARQYGPGKRGPAELQDRAARAIRRGLKARYGDVEVEWKDRKRSILVKFRDPVAPGLPDFTADVIIAIDNVGDRGLYIPRFTVWDRADPEAHSRMIRDANKDTKARFARSVRLIKHWNRRHGEPLCSWNIKALALGCITTSGGLMSALLDWFAHAIRELSKGETPDPARVARPIKMNEPQTVVLNKLREGLRLLQEAKTAEDEGYPAQATQRLSQFFNDEDVLPRPDPGVVLAETQSRMESKLRPTTPALLTNIHSGRERRSAGAWGM